ncbi:MULTISPECIES: TolC family protein [Bacteroides]|jgi:outer membrane protein|uniref:TolC family protein n=2 Tax=Bacteroides clarus TaxID=626929 RepID=A0A1Y3YXX4_9BACE|nr:MULTISPECIES: TolC family protein [Bacteroides]MBS1307671.1 TolC family protein [Bacteroides sp.]EGF51194.1 outer membrane efflux protein [Bacteroides clarus YIT 12056]MCQ1544907.1 TolC family protein [Bacteroides clarus]OKZ02027.1 MAG: transporter [Bacteroides sp. 44_46]OUO02696.1 transporter [Bacteroides clarus]
MKMQRFFEGKKWMLAVAILLAGGYTRAQGTQDTLTLNLDKALEIALSDNPTIKVAEEEIALKKVSHKEAWQNLLPEASISGTMSHTITAPQFSIGDQTVKMGKDKANTATGTLNISLPLFAPAVYRAMSMTKTDIELAVEKSRASKQDLVNQVTKAYYQLMLTQDSYDVLQKSYKLAEDNYNIVNAKYRQGTVSEFDKITAEVQMRSVKPSVISAGNAVTLSKLQLKVLMGITADVDIKIDDSLAAYEGVVFANQLDNTVHEGLVNNTTMKQLELNRLMLQKNIKSLRTNFMPTLGLGYSYQYQSMNNDSWNVFNYNYGSSSSLVFSLSIPLYKASNFTKLKSNRIQMRQLDQNRLDTERKLNMQITSYQDNMSASSEQVSSNKENVMQAEKAVQIAGKRYEVGKGTVLELNTSQVQLTEAELTYNQSIYDYLVAKADLDQVLGRDYIIKNQK